MADEPLFTDTGGDEDAPADETPSPLTAAERRRLKAAAGKDGKAVAAYTAAELAHRRRFVADTGRGDDDPARRSYMKFIEAAREARQARSH